MEVLLDHFLNLLLLGVAVAGEGLFDLVWRVFVDHEIVLFRDEEDNATSLGNRDASGDVLAEEKFLDAETVGMIAIYNLMEGVIDVEEAVAEGGVSRSGDDAAVKHGWTSAIESVYRGAFLLMVGVDVGCDLDDAEAADAGAWIDTEDTHYFT